METLTSNATIKNNSDFLFLYDATQCNPNGDPDQENKPRMDYDTDTNLVTDTRLKRYIRDFLKMTGTDIFVDMEGEAKVSPDSKLKAVINRMLADENELEVIFSERPELRTPFEKIIKEKKEVDTIFKALQDKKNIELNYYILAQLVKAKFIDIRLFGSAFAVGGFTKAYTGPIQINWGYSLNKVELMDSNTIVTIMNDDNSTFGKDYRVHYSLLAFNGTINKYAAKSTGLTEEDLETFRDAIWNSIPALPTRSKLNQYPKIYLEFVYHDGYTNGQFGDLRNYIKVQAKDNLDEKQVRKISQLEIDFSALKTIIENNKGEGKPLKDVIIRTSEDIKF